MRIIGNLNKHPKIATTVFQMNDKYIIKFEAGMMEQVFKVSTAEVAGIEQIDKMLDDVFISKVIERFNDMFLSIKNSM